MPCIRAIIIVSVLLGMLLFAVVFIISMIRLHHEMWKASISYEFSDLHIGFMEYKEAHGRWPSSFQNLDLPSPYVSQDSRTGKLYHCLTDKHVYVFFSRKEKPLKVFVKSDQYRDKIWPFGKTNVFVLYGDKFVIHGSCAVNPEQVVELTPEEVAELSKEKE